MLRRSWVEINIHTILSNYDIYKSCIPEPMDVMAVVKADAYGHGERQVALALQEHGCHNFAVSNLEEAIHIRESGIKGQILVLGYTPISSVQDLIKYDITQAILSEEYAEKLKSHRIKAQFAIDTGMNRIGMDANDARQCESVIRKFSDCFSVTGLFTHLCVADEEKENPFTKEQIRKFQAVVNRVSDLNIQYIHCMNSAGGLWHEAYGNLIRLGIVMYGLKPDYGKTLPCGIKPALEWKSVISMIKSVHKGETIGYGRSYQAEKEMIVATIPTGYADGYNRLLSNKGKVIINGQTAPIVGKVCMDQMMVDVTGLDVSFEDEVTLLGDGYDADDMAHDIGTIGYEVICGISKRVPREFA